MIARIFHRVSWCRLSKAFQKSMKLMVFHSMYWSMMFLSSKSWSMHPLPLLKPACSCLSFWSTVASILSRRILQKTLDGMENIVMPHQLWQFWRFFFRELDHFSLVLVIWYCVLFPCLPEEACKNLSWSLKVCFNHFHMNGINTNSFLILHDFDGEPTFSFKWGLVSMSRMLSAGGRSARSSSDG